MELSCKCQSGGYTEFPFCFRVIAVGGDGIYNEVVSGMADRELRDNGCDPDDPETRLLKLRLPIGIIPAGKSKLNLLITTLVSFIPTCNLFQYQIFLRVPVLIKFVLFDK